MTSISIYCLDLDRHLTPLFTMVADGLISQVRSTSVDIRLVRSGQVNEEFDLIP